MKVRLVSVVVAAIAGSLLCGVPVTVHADTIRDRQWHLEFLQAAAAQQVSQGSGITIAVIDTGVSGDHVDLAGNVLPGTTLMAGQSGDGRTDDDGHGTGMAGLIAAHGHGAGEGALGLAPKAKILPIRVATGFGAGGNGHDLARSIDYAVARGAQVVSISLGASRTDALEQSVEQALASNVVIVAAVGNTETTIGIAAPASYPGVLAVAATDRLGRHAATSLTGPEVVLSAPGVDIVSTGLNGGYRIGTGTSDSTAIVAGAAALVRSKFPNLSAAEVVHRLTATATDAGAPGRDEEYGYGVLNLIDALTKDVPPLQPSVAASRTPTATRASPDPSDGQHNVPRWALAAVVLLALMAAGGMWAAMRDRSPKQ